MTKQDDWVNWCVDTRQGDTERRMELAVYLFQVGWENAVDGENKIDDTQSVSLNRDNFMRTLLRELSGTLQDVVGLEEASGFISVVGQRMGEQINAQYRDALEVSQLSREQISDVLVNLKKRIHGDFFVIEQDDEKIVLGNRACPFGDKVLDRPALCMMTSNVFGVVAAENQDYAKVVLEQTIARGDAGCRVVVYLKSTDESAAANGREYFRAE